MQQMTGLTLKIHEMARRIRELREIENLTAAEMAARTGVSIEEYLACESGERDLNFAFIYRCAGAFNVDVTDIIEGQSPKLRSYTVTRSGEGQRIEQAHGMIYYNLAAAFKNRIAEPLYVNCIYDPAAQTRDIELTSHPGQEVDIVLSGSLKVQVGEHTEILHEGDAIYYDSATPHGMIATGGADCIFYAIVLNPAGESASVTAPALMPPAPRAADVEERVYRSYVITEKNKNGALQKIDFKNTDTFNFAFDVVDHLGKTKPEKLAMLHVAADKTERRLTFKDMSRESSRAANYFKSLGIRRGDRVMLVLKRHYQYWYAILGLHKLGAVAIPASNQLQEHDFQYRFAAAGISAMLCTADGDTARQAELAMEKYPDLTTKIIVGGAREGWHNFDEEYTIYSSHFSRAEDAPCGEDLMLMFFTSGTTGNPKIAAHNYKYPLGHFITAKYWQQVNPNGVHFTISDTGWAKSAWGKLYGQWLCESAIFTYDFDRFDAADILPMFARYQITTFCAPPTMYRMLIKEDLSAYDLSAIRHASTAGEALNPEVFRQFELATGLKIHEGFGQSEGTVTIGNLAGEPAKLGAMGKPVPLYDVHLLSPDGEAVDVGETGEICISLAKGRPCGLSVGYYGDQEATDYVNRDGFYHTGDLAWQDEDGFLWYVGRSDDVIKSSGYRIGPFEIESIIMELPYVLECGVSGAPDELRGQIIKASIVLTKGTEATEDLKKEIQEYVKAHTAPYKYPRIVEFRSELPKTTSGKIQRRLL